MIVIPESHEAWLQERKKGLGASDAGSIIGVNPWKSNQELWREKAGLVEAPDISDKRAVQIGNESEPLIRALFAIEHPEYKVTYESPYKIIRSDVHPFIFCTPDGELEELATGRKGGLEIKTTEIQTASQWKEWDNRIPQHYYAQVCHQMYAAGWEFVVLQARIRYWKNGELRITERPYTIERAEAVNDIKYITQEEIKFWECVQTKKAPPLKLPSI